MLLTLKKIELLSVLFDVMAPISVIGAILSSRGDMLMSAGGGLAPGSGIRSAACLADYVIVSYHISMEYVTTTEKNNYYCNCYYYYYHYYYAYSLQRIIQQHTLRDQLSSQKCER